MQMTGLEWKISNEQASSISLRGRSFFKGTPYGQRDPK